MEGIMPKRSRSTRKKANTNNRASNPRSGTGSRNKPKSRLEGVWKSVSRFAEISAPGFLNDQCVVSFPENGMECLVFSPGYLATTNRKTFLLFTDAQFEVSIEVDASGLESNGVPGTFIRSKRLSNHAMSFTL
jgi:hypothetical protein